MNIPFDVATASLKASVGTIVVDTVVLTVSETGVETDDPSPVVVLVPNADNRVIAARRASSVAAGDDDDPRRSISSVDDVDDDADDVSNGG